MARKSTRWSRSRGLRSITPPPSAPAADAGLRVPGSTRRQGSLERTTRTKVVAQRRRRAFGAGLAMLAIVIGVIVVSGWALRAFEVGGVGRSIGTLGGDDALSAVIRDRIPESGSTRIAVAVTDGDQLRSVGVLGLDSDTKRGWLVAVGPQSAISLGSDHVKVDEAFAADRPDQIVVALESLTGTEVAGFVRIDSAGSERLGIPASAFSEDADVLKAQRQVVVPLLRALQESGDQYGLLALADTAEGSVTTNLGSRDLGRLAGIAAAVPTGAVYSGQPEAARVAGVAVPDTAQARKLVARMAAGKRPASSAAKAPSPKSVKVEIRNGAGLTGVASQVSQILTASGYEIGAVGNANAFVYKETLVVHTGDKTAAAEVAKLLPKGRVVPARGMYAFNADVLVIVGKDWGQQ